MARYRNVPGLNAYVRCAAPTSSAASQSESCDAQRTSCSRRPPSVTNPAARATAWGNVDRRITADAPAVPLVWDRVSMASSGDVDAVANENLGVWDLAFTGLR